MWASYTQCTLSSGNSCLFNLYLVPARCCHNNAAGISSRFLCFCCVTASGDFMQGLWTFASVGCTGRASQVPAVVAVL
jgi:hypothetical protein